MTEGLITRFGKWLDQKWKAKATEEDVADIERAVMQRLEILEAKNKEPLAEAFSKELADLKTRMEKMELYSGMTRKVDPTKPPVVKSAFQM